VRDYLCNRLYGLEESQVEGYLGQLCNLAIQNPSASLDRLLVDLCRRSPRLACKVRVNLLYRNGGDAPRTGIVARCAHTRLLLVRCHGCCTLCQLTAQADTRRACVRTVMRRGHTVRL
jgi:hypothetical protein